MQVGLRKLVEKGPHLVRIHAQGPSCFPPAAPLPSPPPSRPTVSDIARPANREFSAEPLLLPDSWPGSPIPARGFSSRSPTLNQIRRRQAQFRAESLRRQQ